MKTLFMAAKEIQEFFVKQDWKFCFIGGVALQRWGQPRLTRDIDITLFCEFGGEANIIETLLKRYESRISEPEQFALQNRVLLLLSDNGIGIDVALGGLLFEEEMIHRASYFEFLPGLFLKTCSAEDLLILKAFADRLQDRADVDSIVRKQRGGIDRNYVIENLRPLCDLKEAPEIIIRLDKLLTL